MVYKNNDGKVSMTVATTTSITPQKQKGFEKVY